MIMEHTPLTFRDHASLLRLLGHPVRLAIIQRLVTGLRCVTDIQELLEKPQANVSQHLMALRAHRIVDYYEDGKLRCYYLARPGLAKLLAGLPADGYAVVRPSPEQVRRAARRLRGETAAEIPRNGRGRQLRGRPRRLAELTTGQNR